jgi:hypothetical protein
MELRDTFAKSDRYESSASKHLQWHRRGRKRNRDRLTRTDHLDQEFRDALDALGAIAAR